MARPTPVDDPLREVAATVAVTPVVDATAGDNDVLHESRGPLSARYRH